MTYAVAARSSPLPSLLRRSTYAVRELHGVTAVDAKARGAHYELLSSRAVSIRQVMLRNHLAGLHHQWHAETRYLSSLAEKKRHAAYASIVAMGEEAIPLILESVAANADLLVMALHDITNEDPVALEHHGRLAEIVRDWLRWGSERGYRR